jgi:DNA invertase Pin-like site-specific DNA recombinase
MAAELTRVVGYVRVSTAGQADGGTSLDAQRVKLVAYALAMDLMLVDVVVDAGASAKTLERPGLRRALNMLESGEVEGLLVCKLDRLTRSVRDLGVLLDRYFAARCSLLSVGDAIDTRTAAGRLVLNVLASVSQWEREAGAERTRETLGHLRSIGVRLGGEALGWRRRMERDADGRLIPEPVVAERQTIDRIVALRAQGRTLREIARTLAAEGRPTKRGGAWRPEIVRRALHRQSAGDVR